MRKSSSTSAPPKSSGSPSLPPATAESRREGALLLLVPATALAAFPFFSDFTTPKLLVAGLLTALLVGSGRHWCRPGLAGTLGLLYLAASLVPFAAAPDPDAARLELTLDLAALAAWLAAVAAGPGLRRRLPPWLLSAAAGVVAFRLLEALLPGSRGALGSLPGAATLGNPDFTAEFLACLLPVTLLGLLRGPLAARVAAALTLVGTGWVLATHHSATALAAAVVGGAILLLRLPIRSRWIAPTLALLVLLGGLAAVLWLAPQSLAGRAFLYRAGIAAATEKPLRGHGIGGFGQAYMESQGRLLAAEKESRRFWTNARHAHNAAIHLWAERGALPLLLLLLFLALHLRHRPSAPSASNDPHPPGTLPAAAMCAALTVSFLGSVTWDQVPFRLLFMLLLGLSVSPAGPPRPLPGRRLLAGLALLVLVAVPTWHAVGDLLFVRGKVEAAHRLIPGNARIRYALGIVREAEGDLAGAATLLESSLAGHPNLTTLLALGNLETRRGRFAEAERWFLQLLRWKPDFAAGHANLAVLYHRWGKPDAAQRHLTRALSLRPSDPDILRIRQALEAGPLP